MATPKRKAEELNEINTAVLKYLKENGLADTARAFAKEAKLKATNTDSAANLAELYANYTKQ